MILFMMSGLMNQFMLMMLFTLNHMAIIYMTKMQ